MTKVLDYLNSKVIIAILVILAVFTFSNKAAAQVLVAGTQFTPQTVTAGKTFYSITDVSQYGMITGALSVTPALTPNTNAGIFNGTAHYAITTNPDTLDNTRYENLPTATNYMLVFSPPNFNSSGTLMSYTVNGLAPGSNVSATVTFCNVTSTTRVPSCVGQSAPIKGILNPDQYNPTNGDNTSQVSGTQCGTYTWTQASGSSHTVSAGGTAVFNLNQAQSGACEAIGITKIEIYGVPNPTISSSAGTSVCTSEQSILQLNQTYDATTTYQWQKNGTNIAGATNKAYLATASATSGTSDVYQVVVTYGGKSYTSNSTTITSTTCCTSGGSKQTVYYNDFGTFDLTNDPTGKTYYLWDYSNYLSPVQVKYTTTTPFEYSLSSPPPGTTFIANAPVDNNEYTVVIPTPAPAFELLYFRRN